MLNLTLKRYKVSNIYSYIFIALVTIANCLSSVIVQAQINGQGVATQNNEASRLIRVGTNRAWEVFFIGQGGNSNGTVTAIILSFMNIVAFLALVVRLLQVYREITNPKALNEVIAKMLIDKVTPVILVFALITGSGALLSSSVLGLRNASYNIDGKVAATMTRIADINRIAGDYEGEQAALEIVRDKQKDCSKIPATVSGKANPVLRTCLREFQAVVDQQINSGAIKSPSVLRMLRDGARDPNPLIAIGSAVISAVAGAPSAAVKTLVDGYLLLFGLIFTISIEISMLIMAIISSVAISMSLFSLKPAAEWLSKFAGLVIMKVSYTISIGAFQVISDTAGGNIIDGFTSFSFGLAAPFIAILSAWQSAGIVGAGVNAGVFKLAAAGVQLLNGKVATSAGKALGGKIGDARATLGRKGGGGSLSSTPRPVRQ